MLAVIAASVHQSFEGFCCAHHPRDGFIDKNLGPSSPVNAAPPIQRHASC